MLNPDHIRRTARAYAIRCNDEGRCVSLKELCFQFGVNQQWLSTGLSKSSRQARLIVLKEFAQVGVNAQNRLKVSIAEAAGLSCDGIDREWEITEAEWPSLDELPRILGTPGRREMFTHLRDSYGRAVAFRYAYVCAHPPAKGAHFGKGASKEVARAVV